MNLFELMDEGFRAKCAGQEHLYTDYGDPNDPDDQFYQSGERKPLPPSDQAARIMCEGCPLMVACARFADETKPTWGVYAGRVYGRRK